MKQSDGERHILYDVTYKNLKHTRNEYQQKKQQTDRYRKQPTQWFPVGRMKQGGATWGTGMERYKPLRIN